MLNNDRKINIMEYLSSLKSITPNSLNFINRYDVDFDDIKREFKLYMSLMNDSSFDELTIIINKLISLIDIDKASVSNQIVQLKERFNYMLVLIYNSFEFNFRIKNNIPMNFCYNKIEDVMSASMFVHKLHQLKINREKYVYNKIKDILVCKLGYENVSSSTINKAYNIYNLIINNEINICDEVIFDKLKNAINNVNFKLDNIAYDIDKKLFNSKKYNKNYDIELINYNMDIICKVIYLYEINDLSNIDINKLCNISFTDDKKDKSIIDRFKYLIYDIYICFSNESNCVNFIIYDKYFKNYYLVSENDITIIDFDNINNMYNVILLDSFINNSNQVNNTKINNGIKETILCNFDNKELVSVNDSNVSYFVRDKSTMDVYNCNRLFILNKIKDDIINRLNCYKNDNFIRSFLKK